MINIAIVEDDVNSGKVLKGFIERYGKEKNLQFSTVIFNNALDFLDGYKPIYDLVFMDILLPGINGFEAAKKLRDYDKSVLLIFITNLQQFAVKGYEVNALDFIVKPAYYQGFAIKMDKAVKLIGQNESQEIVIKNSAGYKKVTLKSIYYIEVIGHKLIFHTFDSEFDCNGSLTEFENKLKEEDFARCNNCYLVNLKHVSSIEKFDVIMANGDVLKISQPKRKMFLSVFADWLGKGNYL